MDPAELELDLLVIGGGMAGLTTAARAAQLGASVVVVESTGAVGGSAALSGGYVWTAPSREAFLDEDPEGDSERFQAVLDGYDDAFGWVAGLGVRQGEPETGIKGFGKGRQIDIGHYFQRLQAVIESAGGWVVLNTDAETLLVDDGRIVGARVQRQGGEAEDIHAAVTVISTGGFQADAAFRERYIGAGAGDIVLRSNERSRGDGIRMGLEAGGCLTEHMDGYYGHLIPYPLERFEPADHVALAQYHSEHALLLDHRGQRFSDESLGDHVGNQAVGAVGTALLLIDERIRREHVLAVYMSGFAGLDKLAEGAKHGAHYASAGSLEEVAEAASAWGYERDGIVATVNAYNAWCQGDQQADLDPPRKRFREPLLEPPFAVLEVQAAITFTYGGLRTDLDGRVLTGAGEPIPGLYATGVDAGGLNRRGYTGGLIRGLVLGRRLAEHLTTTPAVQVTAHGSMGASGP